MDTEVPKPADPFFWLWRSALMVMAYLRQITEGSGLYIHRSSLGS